MKNNKRTNSTSLKKMKVFLGSKSHEVYIGENALEWLGKALKKQPSKRAFVIADQKLVSACDLLVQVLHRNHWEVHQILVQAGETLKDFHSIYPLYADLFKRKANRDSVVFALGGGTIGDAGGFIASTYLRGLRWVGIPTTLLAQVDSSLGGKTGINHLAGKNLIGTFHQPSLVICDTRLLKTLGKREIISGLGEMIKYALVFDSLFFQFLTQNMDHILSLDQNELVYAIQKCLQWKAKIIQKDELDRTGIREVLNFGHTFGHALESITHYNTFQHGEAIIFGMRFALALSEVRKKLNQSKRLKIDSFLSRIPVPPLPLDLDFDELVQFMKQDKKIRKEKIHFVLLKDLGKSITDSDVTDDDLRVAYQLLQKEL